MNLKKREGRRGSGLFIFLVIGMIFIVALIFSIFHMAKKIAGPATSRLSLPAKIKYSMRVILNRDSLQSPIDFLDLAEKKLVIDGTEPVFELCNRLETEGFVTNGKTLCDYLIYSGKDRSIQPGYYTIFNRSTILETGERLGNVAYRDIPLYVFAGWRIEEIANAIDDYPLRFDSHAFLNLITDPPQSMLDFLQIPSNPSLEGFILPGLYSLKPEISLEETVWTMVNRFSDEIIKTGLSEMIEQQGLSLREGLTLASIIQRETLAAEEMPIIASVFYNRLSMGMKLETDVTVQYALGWQPAQQTWWKTALTWDDFDNGSPYNTYKFFGLPPGPLCSSSLDAIQAIAQPAKTAYLFFRAACDGSGKHVFAKTYEEHLQNGCE